MLKSRMKIQLNIPKYHVSLQGNWFKISKNSMLLKILDIKKIEISICKFQQQPRNSSNLTTQFRKNKVWKIYTILSSPGRKQQIISQDLRTAKDRRNVWKTSGPNLLFGQGYKSRICFLINYSVIYQVKKYIRTKQLNTRQINMHNTRNITCTII